MVTKEVRKESVHSSENSGNHNIKLVNKLKKSLQKIFIFFILIIALGVLISYIFLLFSKKVGTSAISFFKIDYSKVLEILPNTIRERFFGKDESTLKTQKGINDQKQNDNSQNSLEQVLHYNRTTGVNGMYSPYNEPIVKVVQQVLPGVVSIALERTDLAYGGLLVDQQAKIGSGFVVDAKQGIIVTNRHVVESIKGQTYKVILQNGKSLSITKVLEDPVNDLAFVFVNTAGIKLHALPLGDSSTLALGQQVIAIGTPFGEFPSTVTSGIISGLHRKVNAPADWGEKIYFDVIQTDAAINPGNSGGPLINLAGEVVGINFAKINGADNISFALPINLVKQRLEQYKKYGRFRQAFLGVSVKEIDLAAANYYGVPAGAFVLRVVPNSPAYKAGIKAKDIIVSIDKQPVYKVGLINILSQYSVGDTIEIHLKRPIINKDGYGYHFKDITVKAKLADRYDFISSPR